MVWWCGAARPVGLGMRPGRPGEEAMMGHRAPPKKFRESLLRTVVCALRGSQPRVRCEQAAHQWPFTPLALHRRSQACVRGEQKTSHLSAEQKDCKYSSSSLTKIVICLGGKRVKRFPNTNSDQQLGSEPTSRVRVLANVMFPVTQRACRPVSLHHPTVPSP